MRRKKTLGSQLKDQRQTMGRCRNEIRFFVSFCFTFYVIHSVVIMHLKAKKVFFLFLFAMDEGLMGFFEDFFFQNPFVSPKSFFLVSER